MSRDHPSDSRLLRWAEAGTGPGVARHLRQCGPCEQRLETLVELAPHARAELDAALAPDGMFEHRLHERLNRRLLDQETLAVLGDLLEVGPVTSRLLLDPEPEDDDNHG